MRWRVFNHEETEMLISTEKVSNFAHFENVLLGITRLFGNPYGDVYALTDGWQHIGYIQFDVRSRIATQIPVAGFVPPVLVTLLNRLRETLGNRQGTIDNPFEDETTARLLFGALNGDILTNVHSMTEVRVTALLDKLDALINFAGTRAWALALVQELQNNLLNGLLRVAANLRASSFMRQVQNHHRVQVLLASILGIDGINERLIFNRSIERDIIRNGYIHGQGNPPQADMWIGSLGRGNDHGCGPFAVYNILFYLMGGDTLAEEDIIRPSDIINSLDLMGGFNVHGVLGTNPEAMVDYLRTVNGINVSRPIYVPGNLDSLIRASRVCILLYAGNPLYVHYVMIRYVRRLTNFGFIIGNF